MPRLAPGDKAPAFSLEDQHGHTVSLADFKGRTLLVFFYPKANTPGCTIQACSVRDARDDFSKLDTAVIGVSPDKAKSQATFDTKYGLSFPLLCDVDHEMAEAYGVWGEKTLYGKKYMGITRSSFLIDERGRIAGAWYKVTPGDTVPNALALLGQKG
jgi:thioredoxin-dependent peroxiredoxin